MLTASNEILTKTELRSTLTTKTIYLDIDLATVLKKYMELSEGGYATIACPSKHSVLIFLQNYGNVV